MRHLGRRLLREIDDRHLGQRRHFLDGDVLDWHLGNGHGLGSRQPILHLCPLPHLNNRLDLDDRLCLGNRLSVHDRLGVHDRFSVHDRLRLNDRLRYRSLLDIHIHNLGRLDDGFGFRNRLRLHHNLLRLQRFDLDDLFLDDLFLDDLFLDDRFLDDRFGLDCLYRFRAHRRAIVLLDLQKERIVGSFARWLRL